MAREVSIITPVRSGHADYLAEAWESVRGQRVPLGWFVRWYVQEDGPTSTVRDFVASLDSTQAEYAASGVPGGAAEARNLALARSDGEVVMLLDADDQLAPGAVERVLTSLDFGHMWCGFAAVDQRGGQLHVRDGRYSARLDSSGTVVGDERDFDASEWMGEVPRGSLHTCWDTYGVLPFHPTTFSTYTRWIWEVGGWPGLSRDEDTALILAISDAHAGMVSGEVNVHYRRHREQTSRQVPPLTERIRFITRRRR
ncbi:MAG: glycosyltransferase [Ilumatobacteraceae bacterium]